MTSALDQLKQYTTVVADTGNFQQLGEFKPQDATTNPSLILKAVQNDAYKPLLEKTVKDHASKPMAQIIDQLLIAFGKEILKIVPVVSQQKSTPACRSTSRDQSRRATSSSSCTKTRALTASAS